jgi:prevent-host-death family protein
MASPTVTNIHEAKTHLSRLVERAAAGEEIVIGKAGKPMAKLVPFKAPRPKRRPGAWKGKVWIAPNFDELPPEIYEAFNEGKDL